MRPSSRLLPEKGTPTPMVWTRMRMPRSLMAVISTDEIAAAAKFNSTQAKQGRTFSRRQNLKCSNRKNCHYRNHRAGSTTPGLGWTRLTCYPYSRPLKLTAQSFGNKC